MVLQVGRVVDEVERDRLLDELERALAGGLGAADRGDGDGHADGQYGRGAKQALHVRPPGWVDRNDPRAGGSRRAKIAHREGRRPYPPMADPARMWRVSPPGPLSALLRFTEVPMPRAPS